MQLKGFVGARWIVHEFFFSPDDIKRIYKKDIGKAFTGYNRMGKTGGDAQGGKEDYACVYEYHDLQGGLMSAVCVGYPDFLEEPKNPENEFEQGHPFFVLSFNDVEDDEDIYCPSDVEQMRPHSA